MCIRDSANIVIVCTNALVTSTISAASGNAVAEILGTHTLERVIAVLSVQILLIYIFGIILKITADKDVALRSNEWLLILSVFVVSFVSITFIHMSQLYSCLLYTSLSLRSGKCTHLQVQAEH